MVLKSRQSEIRLVAILTLVVGIMSFEQASVFYLVPFIQKELKLSNTQVGLLATCYWAMFAMSSYAMSVFADVKGGRKELIVGMTMLLSVASVLSGLATSFATLLIARSFMGLIEGPIVPIAQSIIELESAPQRRGTNTGFVGNFSGGLFGMFVAPLVLVRLATHYNWRDGFFVVLIPGLVCAILSSRFISHMSQRETIPYDAGGSAPKVGGRLMESLRFRNIWLCCAICCFFIAYVTIGLEFLPLFYVNVRQFSPEEMSLLMGLLGLSAVLFGVLAPMASDRIGRKPVMIITNLLSLLCPLGAVYYSGPIAVLGFLVFIGTALQGTSSLISGTIPSESVPARCISTAMGLILAFGVLTGGLAFPIIAGWSADHWSLRAPLLLQAGCAAMAALISMALRETARLPRGELVVN